MYFLLVNHLLQMVFLKDFYDENRRVNTKNTWVWGVHAISYAFTIYIYIFTDAAKNDKSESRRIWIPLDCILTCCIAGYQVAYHFMQFMEETKAIDPRKI